MFRKLVLGFFLLLLPFAAFAEDEVSPAWDLVDENTPVIREGSVLKQERSSRKYLIFQGKKWKIGNAFTLKELGVKPKDMLTASKTELAGYPDGDVLKLTPPSISGKFDMHEHYTKDGKIEVYLGVAKKLGVEKTLFVPTGKGPDNAGYKENMADLLEVQKKYPDRIIAYCSADEADPEAPKIFEDCLDKGGKGLKLMVGHPNFYDVAIDSAIMKELFTVARDRDVPTLLHVSIITTPKAKDELKNLLNEFPEVRVQFAHYCSSIYNGINLDQCAEFLDAYPNLYIDLSMGGGIQRYFKYMTEDIEPIKAFLLKYQDRIFYGTDMIVSGRGVTTNAKWVRGRMMCDFSLHQEKWYKCPTANDKGEYALLPGLELPEEVLKKLYIENPKKFLRLDEVKEE